MLPFNKKLQQICHNKQSDIFLLLKPIMSEMPAPIHFIDDPFFPFSKEIISATQTLVCGYIFDFPAYMAHGAAGARALERSIAYAGNDNIKILHGNFASAAYIPMIYENALGADAATIINSEDYTLFTQDQSHGAFVVQPNPHNIKRFGQYDEKMELLISENDMTFRIAGEDILYASHLDDFATQCLLALERFKQP